MTTAMYTVRLAAPFPKPKVEIIREPSFATSSMPTPTRRSIPGYAKKATRGSWKRVVKSRAGANAAIRTTMAQFRAIRGDFHHPIAARIHHGYQNAPTSTPRGEEKWPQDAMSCRPPRSNEIQLTTASRERSLLPPVKERPSEVPTSSQQVRGTMATSVAAAIPRQCVRIGVANQTNSRKGM